jgi:hypothetical protein
MAPKMVSADIRRHISQTEALQNQQIVRLGGTVDSPKRVARRNVLRIVNSDPVDRRARCACRRPRGELEPFKTDIDLRAFAASRAGRQCGRSFIAGAFPFDNPLSGACPVSLGPSMRSFGFRPLARQPCHHRHTFA